MEINKLSCPNEAGPWWVREPGADAEWVMTKIVKHDADGLVEDNGHGVYRSPRAGEWVSADPDGEIERNAMLTSLLVASADAGRWTGPQTFDAYIKLSQGTPRQQAMLRSALGMVLAATR